MQPRPRAALALVALLLALLAPAHHHHTGTAAARVTAAVPDAAPAVRASVRDQVVSPPLLDATGATGSVAAVPAAAARSAETVALPAYLVIGADRSRGPPQG